MTLVTYPQPHILIEITEDLLTRANRSSSTSCPVAIALRESGYPEARVYRATWNPNDDDMCTTHGAIRLPRATRDFIAAFDYTMSTDAPLLGRVLEIPLVDYVAPE